MHVRQPLRLTHSSIPLDIITDTACDNASRRRTRCRGRIYFAEEAMPDDGRRGFSE